MGQDLPIPRPDQERIADLVIEDIKARMAIGIETYGVALTAFNGRDALQDRYEELLDAACYTKQEMVERGSRDRDTVQIGLVKAKLREAGIHRWDPMTAYSKSDTAEATWNHSYITCRSCARREFEHAPVAFFDWLDSLTV